MRRREFITLLGGAAAGWPLAARAQQQAKMPTIGFLGAATASVWTRWTAAFIDRLHELGWIEGRTVAIEFRWAEGRASYFSEIAAEFNRLQVDAIFTAGSGPVVAAKRATSVIPIVFALAVDPVGAGLVPSLARPGGNVTGLSVQSSDLAGKRLELLRECIPTLRTLAILANVGNPGAVLEMGEATAAARALSFDILPLQIRRAEDIAPAIESLNGRADALYVGIDPLLNANQDRICGLALDAHIPTVFGSRSHLEVGGLMSYGANFPDLFRRAAEIVDKILRGARPADIPVEQASKFDFVINLVAAKALGLEIPPLLLARADEVIE